MDARGKQHFFIYFFTHRFLMLHFRTRTKALGYTNCLEIRRLVLTTMSPEQEEQRQREEENQAHKVAKKSLLLNRLYFQ